MKYLVFKLKIILRYILTMKLSKKVYKGMGLAFLILFIACSPKADYDLGYTWSAVEISSDIKGSEDVEAIIAPYRNSLDSIMNEEIGYALHDLTSKGKYESTLGTFITKLSVEQSIASFGKDVDVAIMNHHGGIRAPINEGPITLGDVFEVMPFENEMVLLEISGDSLVQLIKFIGKTGNSMIWPVQFHVSESGLENIRVNNIAIEMDKNYLISTSDYLANGGSGFRMLKSLKRLEVPTVKLRDMIVQEIREQTARGDSIETDVSNFITTSDL